MNQKTQELLTAIDYFSKKGWSPATSTNYSYLDGSDIIISRSGVDKSQFKESDLIKIKPNGELVNPAPGVKSSAETGIHLFLYKHFPEAQCVLHTHSVAGTYLSQKFYSNGELVFDGYEILKGLKGNETHLMREYLPIVNNSQDMAEIIEWLIPVWQTKPHGFLIAGHGLYTWGTSIAEARRHIETFEFLFEIKLLETR